MQRAVLAIDQRQHFARHEIGELLARRLLHVGITDEILVRQVLVRPLHAGVVHADHDHRRDLVVGDQSIHRFVRTPFVVADVTQAGVEYILPIEQVEDGIAAILVGGICIAVWQQHADLAFVAEDRAPERVHAQVAGHRRLAFGRCRGGRGLDRTDQQHGNAAPAGQQHSHRIAWA